MQCVFEHLVPDPERSRHHSCRIGHRPLKTPKSQSNPWPCSTDGLDQAVKQKSQLLFHCPAKSPWAIKPWWKETKKWLEEWTRCFALQDRDLELFYFCCFHRKETVRWSDYHLAASPWGEIPAYLTGRTEQGPVADGRQARARIKLHICHSKVISHWNKHPRKMWTSGIGLTVRPGGNIKRWMQSGDPTVSWF